MTQWRVGFLIVLLGGLMLGCAQRPDSAGLRVHTIPNPAQEAGDRPAAAAEGGEPQSVAAANPCLDCHQDQQKLIDTVAAIEEVPEESSGVG